MSIENPVYKLISISASGSADSLALLAAKASGLEFSLDGGRIWQDAYRSLELDEPVGTFAVGAAHFNGGQLRVFAGIAGGVLLAGLENGFKAIPWQKAQVPSPPPLITDLAISPTFAADGLILAATLEDGVLHSSNHGHSWIGWNFNLLDQSVLSLEISPRFGEDHTVYCGTESGVFVSKNGGKSWVELALPIDYDPVLSLALSPDFGKGGCLWVGTETKGLWYACDDGQKWELVKEIDPEVPINAIQILQPGAGQSQIVVMSAEWIRFKSLSGDPAEAWQVFQPPLDADCKLTAICAPSGLGQGQPFWLGFSNGEVSTFSI